MERLMEQEEERLRHEVAKLEEASRNYHEASAG